MKQLEGFLVVKESQYEKFLTIKDEVPKLLGAIVLGTFFSAESEKDATIYMEKLFDSEDGEDIFYVYPYSISLEMLPQLKYEMKTEVKAKLANE